MELIQLVEVQRFDILQDKNLIDVYEVYSGDWVQVYGLSANAYWHTYEYWQTNMQQYPYVDRRFYMATRAGAYVGHWETLDGFYEFVEKYLRGTVKEIVAA